MSRKSRSRRRRKAVDRTERVKPSELAERKKRPWVMAGLLHLGPDKGGTSAEQHEAALQIAEAFEALTSAVGYKPTTVGALFSSHAGWGRQDVGPRQLRLISIYLGWSRLLVEALHLRPHVIVEWVNQQLYLDAQDVPTLLRALDVWTRTRDEWRPDRLTPPPSRVLTAPVRCSARPQRTHQPHPNAAQGLASTAAIARCV